MCQGNTAALLGQQFCIIMVSAARMRNSILACDLWCYARWLVAVLILRVVQLMVLPALQACTSLQQLACNSRLDWLPDQT